MIVAHAARQTRPLSRTGNELANNGAESQRPDPADIDNNDARKMYANETGFGADTRFR